jgi:hypothetical protein
MTIAAGTVPEAGSRITIQIGRDRRGTAVTRAEPEDADSIPSSTQYTRAGTFKVPAFSFFDGAFKDNHTRGED